MKNINMYYFKNVMKILLVVTTLFIFFICVQNATASEMNTTTTEYKYFTEIAGRNIAEDQAKNWSNDAELIRITVPNSTIVENGATIDYCATEFCYIYKSGNKYFDVLINSEEYEKGTSRTEEMSRVKAEQLGFNGKIPLVDWNVTSQSAFKIVLNSYNNMSLDSGDVIGRIYLETAEINGANIPVWYISIKDGITGLDTNYTINADSGDILIPTSTNKTTKVVLPSGTAAGLTLGNSDWSKYSGAIRFLVVLMIVIFIGLAVREKQK